MKSKKIRIRIVAEMVVDSHEDLTAVTTAIEEAIDGLRNHGDAELDSFIAE